jgi:hypothetical protein
MLIKMQLKGISGEVYRKLVEFAESRQNVPAGTSAQRFVRLANSRGTIVGKFYTVTLEVETTCLTDAGMPSPQHIGREKLNELLAILNLFPR